MKANAVVVYLVLAVCCVAVAIWQIVGYQQLRQTVVTAQMNRAHDIANSLAVVIRSQRRFGAVPQNRLFEALEDLAKSQELLGIALLNPAGDVIAAAGRNIELGSALLTPGVVHHDAEQLIVASLVELGSDRSSRRADALSADAAADQVRSAAAVLWSPENAALPPPTAASTGAAEPAEPAELSPEQERASRREHWERMRQSHHQFQPLEQFAQTYARQGLYMMVLLMDVQTASQMIARDRWLRAGLIAIAVLAAVGLALAWRAAERSNQLQLRLAQARASNNYLRELNLAAAGLAHETRNPLNIVRSITQLTAADADVPAAARQRLAQVLDEVDRMSARLNEFIDYSRPREPQLSAVAPLVLARDVARTLETDFQDKNIEFHCPEANIEIYADPAMLRQVLFNLLLNAAQAIAPGGRIELRLTTCKGKLQLQVIDNGPGVPPEAHEEIFRPYVALRDHGCGLGLAIVRQIVVAHGWQIVCLANDPGGCCLQITNIDAVAMF